MIYVTSVFSFKFLNRLILEEDFADTTFSIVDVGVLRDELSDLDRGLDYSIYASSVWGARLLEHELGGSVRKKGYTEVNLESGDTMYIPLYSGPPLDGFDKGFTIPEGSVTWYKVECI